VDEDSLLILVNLFQGCENGCLLSIYIPTLGSSSLADYVASFSVMYRIKSPQTLFILSPCHESIYQRAANLDEPIRELREAATEGSKKYLEGELVPILAEVCAYYKTLPSLCTFLQ